MIVEKKGNTMEETHKTYRWAYHTVEMFSGTGKDGKCTIMYIIGNIQTQGLQ